MQHNIGKKVLGIVSKIVNYIKTHEEGWVIPYYYENIKVAGRNQLVELSRLIGRRGSKIERKRWSYADEREGFLWSTGLNLVERKRSGIRAIRCTAYYEEGKLLCEIELTAESVDVLKSDDPPVMKQGKPRRDWTVGTDWSVITYEGETAEEVLNKMTQDGWVIPRDERIGPANLRRTSSMNENMERITRRLVVEGIVPERVARSEQLRVDDLVSAEKAQEVLNDQNKWDDLANKIKDKLESTPPDDFERWYNVPKEEALGKKEKE